MKRLFILTILFSSIFGIINAQVETHYYEKGGTPNLRHSISKSIMVKRMPAFDIEKVKEENVEKDVKTGLCHFGKGFDVSYTLADGIWEDAEGGRLWTMAFESPGALSLNFVFDDFFLPEGAELYVTNEDESVVFGPVTHEALYENGHFLTDIISGSHATISLFESFECLGQSTLTIKRVVHGYIDGFVSQNYSSGTRSQYTYDSPNVACYSNYEEVSDGVGLIMTSDGGALGTGSLVMTTDYSFKPYFLTSYFFIDRNDDGTISYNEISDAENCMVKFRCKYEDCNGLVQATSYTYNQTYYRSAYRFGVMGLLELRSSLTGNPYLTWLGWDRNPFQALGATLFYSDDLKLRIALCNCTPLSFSDNGINCTKISHYIGYPIGAAVGAPFIDSNKRISAITFGYSYITDPNYPFANHSYVQPLLESWYGGGTNSTGLDHWLNPQGTYLNVMSSNRVMKIIGSNQIANSCSYYVQNLPSDMTVIWSLSDYYYNQNCLQQNTPNSNQCTITRSSVQEMTNATLTATLKRNGTTMCSFQKAVSTYGFNGTYYNGVSTQQINLPSPLEVLPGITARITSQHLVGASVTQTGGNLTPNYMSFNSTHDELYIGIPSSPTGAIVLGVSCSGGASYTIPILNTLSNSLLSVMPSANQLEILLTPSAVIENTYLGDSIYQLADKRSELISPVMWNLEIYNAQTGERMTNMSVTGLSFTLDTSSWGAGVYVVRTTIGNEVLCEKVYIK